MSGEGKNPQSSPVIAVTATTELKSGEAVSHKAPAIGTAPAVARQSLKANATDDASGTSSGFSVSAGGGDAAAGFSAATSSGNTKKPETFTVTTESEEEAIESLLKDNAKEGDETTDPDEQGKVEVKKDVIKELLQDYQIPKDDSLKEAFKTMLDNIFIFKDNLAIIRKEWKEKQDQPNPGLKEAIEEIEDFAKKKGITKKPPAQEQATSSPTVTPVPKSPDLTDKKGTSLPVGGELLSKTVVKAKEKFLSLLKKKNPNSERSSDSEKIGKAAPTETASGDKGTSTQAAVNPELAVKFAIKAEEMGTLSRSSSELGPRDVAAETAKPVIEEPAMLMQKQHAAAEVAREDQKLPRPATSDGPDGSRIGTPVTAVGPHRAP